MNGIVRPKGGAAPSVYWRRRLVLLAVVLLVAAGGFKVFGGGGGDGGNDAEPQASTQAGDDDDAKADTADDPDKDDKAKPNKRNKRRNRGNVAAGERDVPVNLRETGTCEPADVTVTPSFAANSYADGDVTVRLALTTNGDAPCEFSLSENTPLVSISDGSDLVWESQKCTDLIDAASVRLEPGWRTYVDATWSGRASVHQCGENADFADSGSYEVQAAVLGGEPMSTTTELAEKPEPDKDKADKKTKKNKKNADEQSDDEKQADDEKQSDEKQSDEKQSDDPQT